MSFDHMHTLYIEISYTNVNTFICTDRRGRNQYYFFLISILNIKFIIKLAACPIFEICILSLCIFI